MLRKQHMLKLIVECCKFHFSFLRVIPIACIITEAGIGEAKLKVFQGFFHKKVQNDTKECEYCHLKKINDPQKKK